MATLKQKKALIKLVENGGNVSQAMMAVNYSPATAKTPQKLTKSKGFQELCEEFGLTDDFLINALVNDIRDKPKNRKPELELAFKVKGKLNEDKNTTVNIGTKTIIVQKTDGNSNNQTTA